MTVVIQRILQAGDVSVSQMFGRVCQPVPYLQQADSRDESRSSGWTGCGRYGGHNGGNLKQFDMRTSPSPREKLIVRRLRLEALLGAAQQAAGWAIISRLHRRAGTTRTVTGSSLWTLQRSHRRFHFRSRAGAFPLSSL